jgi:hypothetical protein
MKLLFEIAIFLVGGVEVRERKGGWGGERHDKFRCQARLTRQPKVWRFHIYGWVLHADDDVCLCMGDAGS